MTELCMRCTCSGQRGCKGQRRDDGSGREHGREVGVEDDRSDFQKPKKKREREREKRKG
jgi:hypothetical protein